MATNFFFNVNLEVQFFGNPLQSLLIYYPINYWAYSTTRERSAKGDL